MGKWLSLGSNQSKKEVDSRIIYLLRKLQRLLRYFRERIKGKGSQKLTYRLISPSVKKVRSQVLYLYLTLDYSCMFIYKVNCSLYLRKHVIYVLCLFFSIFLIILEGEKYILYSYEEEFNLFKLYLPSLFFTTFLRDILSP